MTKEEPEYFPFQLYVVAIPSSKVDDCYELSPEPDKFYVSPEILGKKDLILHPIPSTSNFSVDELNSNNLSFQVGKVEGDMQPNVHSPKNTSSFVPDYEDDGYIFSIMGRYLNSKRRKLDDRLYLGFIRGDDFLEGTHGQRTRYPDNLELYDWARVLPSIKILGEDPKVPLYMIKEMRIDVGNTTGPDRISLENYIVV